MSLNRTRRPDSCHSSALAESLETRRLLAAINLLASLNSSQTQGAKNLIEDHSSNLFFLANNGTTSNDAGLYELPAGASTPTLLVTFPGQSGDVGALAFDIEGDLVGIANTGGAHNDGFVWELKTGATAINTLAPFDSTTGSAPQLGANLVTDANGNLFGTTQVGGADNGGTVWEIVKDSGVITPLASFQQSVSNKSANGLTIDSNGNLFGTIGRDISVSGAHGSVWELAKGGSSINVLAAFNGTNGDSPNCPLYIDPSGNVFGEANGGGSSINATNTVGDGVIFEIPAGSNSITDLASFTGANGSGPKEGVVADSNGNIFCSTASGGSGQGTVSELPRGASTITALGTFDFTSTGTGPNSILLDPSGNVLGTTNLGGSNGGGTIFKITPGSSSGGGGGGGGGASSLTGTLTGKVPSSVIAGQKINLSQILTLTDSGSSAISGPTNVKLFLSTGTTVDTNSIQIASTTKNIKLKPNAHYHLPLKATSLPSSVPNNTYHPVAQVTDSAGNTVIIPSSSTIQVAPPQIDLTGSFSKTPVPGKGGKTILPFTVTNNGNIPLVGNLSYRVFISPDGQFADATSITDLTKKFNLKNGKTQKVTGTVTLPQGSNFIFIQLDPSNTFNDVNPANNTFATSAAVTV